MDRQQILNVLKELVEQQLEDIDPDDVEVYEESDDGSVTYRLVVSGIYTVHKG